MSKASTFVAASAVGFFLSLFCFAAPASALDVNQAIQMCEDRGPACTYYRGADGDVSITVDNGENGVSHIQCFSGGDRCFVERRRPPRNWSADGRADVVDRATTTTPTPPDGISATDTSRARGFQRR
jgi:hypothetical protein